MIKNVFSILGNSLRHIGAAFALVTTVEAGPAVSADRPNILWITTEDMGLHLGSYGDPDAVTPVLDDLAQRSLRFTRAQAPAGVCAPSRSSIITGVYASSLGSQHMRSRARLPDHIKLLPTYLRKQGYYCSNQFKEDYNFETPADAWHASDREADWRGRAPDQPFFSVINFMTTHESRLRFDDERFAQLTHAVTAAQRQDPATVTLPAWLPDTPEVRREWARYHEMITAMDHRVGRVLSRLEQEGLADDTIVFFFSDHGAGFPRAKQFNYEAGLEVPLLIHVPEKWQDRIPAAAGTVNNRLVSLLDLAPTTLALLGMDVPSHMQGQVFLGDRAVAPRTQLASIRDRMDERIDLTRTLRDDRFKYHRNYQPHVPHFPWLDYMDRLESARAFRQLADDEALPPGLASFMAEDKPVEELYDLSIDPHELNNLASDPAHAVTLARMRAAHFQWVRDTRDTGLVPEQMLRELSAGRSEYAFAQSSDYELERTLAVARLIEAGAAAVPELVKALEDDFGPVRYWAATNLVALGEEARAASPVLRRALDDPAAEVAVAAAEALVQLEQSEVALAVLTYYVGSQDLLERLAAANALDRLDADAAPARARMEAIAAEDPGEMTPLSLRLMAQWVLQRALFELDESGVAAATEPLVPLTAVGVAEVDITPAQPVRLHGFPRGERAVPVSAVAQPIKAQAIAIGEDHGAGPVLLVQAEVLGVSDAMTRALAERLAEDVGFDNPDRLTLLANHNHSAPNLSTVAPYVLRKPASPEQAQQIAAYESRLMDDLVAVAKAALADRRPAQLAHGMGQGDFAMNRRIVKDGEWVGFGDNPEGPVDHDLPVMTVKTPTGDLRAIWMSYACHGVCWQRPSFHGDWMGVAREELTSRHEGIVVMVSVGCAGNINPLDKYFRGQDPVTPGRSAARVVEQVLQTEMKPLSGAPEVQLERFDLPLQAPPSRAELGDEKYWFANVMRERLEGGETLANTLPFVAQSWRFGSDLMVMFLSGEVHVQYGLKLKERPGADRLWVKAYANASPGYIPAASELPEGGWEVDGSRRNYGIPARLDPAAEGILHARLAAMVSEEFVAGDAGEGEWWKNTGHPKGKWWLTYDGYEGEAADKIWESVPIPPSPLLSPREALDSMQLDDRFRIELVAAEPMVVRPVFMRFDEAGRLWVVEMPGYMRDIDGTGEEDPSGRVVVLEDIDDDGQMDRSTTFLDGLVMPRTLALVPRGALVVEPPRIWLARDLDGDLIADEKTLLVEDYGVTGNPEHSANGLLPALDNWMYSAKSAVRHQYRDGRLLAENSVFRGQWGISQDDTGRLFYNYNASPLHADLAPGQYFLAETGPNLALRRNVQGPALLNVGLVEDKSLFPARVTPMVTLGASDLRPDGTLKQFTAASSPLIYRGDLFPAEMRGDALIADPVGNLVSHLKLSSDGVRLQADRTRPGEEFLASTDERFRPVFLESGPDGALYIADMYTGIIEHKRYVTDYLRSQVLGRNLGRFTATGRIYRVVPKGAPRAPAASVPSSPAEWVAQLDDPNGWTRDTAQRILVQGQHHEAVPYLKQLAGKAAASPLGRLHALWTLEGLEALTPTVVRRGLTDEDARVRAAAVRLTERLTASELAKSVLELAADPADSVRLQVLLTTGTWETAMAWSVTQAMLADSTAPVEFGLAAAAGLRGRELEYLATGEARVGARTLTTAENLLLRQMGYNVLLRGDSAEIFALLEQLNQLGSTSAVAAALWRGASAHQRNGAPLGLPMEPAIFAKLATWNEGDVLSAAESVFAHLTWPEDPRFVAEVARPLTDAEQMRFERGREIYTTICAACHQTDGMGMAGVAPPLVGSEWVTGNPRVATEIVLRGVAGPIEVRGRTWDMVMPGFGSVPGLFDDAGVAAITTYIRRAWGNQASPVTAEDVTRIREMNKNRTTPWTASELLALPEYPLIHGDN